MKAMLTGIAMALVLFGVHEVGYGARYEREYTRRSELPTLTREERRAVNAFFRVNGLSGIPDECELYIDFDGDPTEPEDYALECRTIRVMGTAQ